VPLPPVVNGNDWSKGKWVTCDADEWPFHPYNAGEFLAAQGTGAEADAMRMTALKEIQDIIGRMKFWGQHGYLNDGLRNLQLGLEAFERERV
jgi:hypothetical protein